MDATIALYWILTLTLPDIQSGGDMANLSRQWANSGEFEVISIAADRNECRGEDFLLLLAIRKAENGRKTFLQEKHLLTSANLVQYTKTIISKESRLCRKNVPNVKS